MPSGPFLLKGEPLWHHSKRHTTPTTLIRRISDTLPIHFGQPSESIRTAVRIGPDHCPIKIGLLSEMRRNTQHRVQLTTDGHKPYLTAVEDAFGADIDYATLQKIYGIAPEQGEVCFSPAQCMGARKAVISGTPDFKHVSTSHTERQNLTMRMQMRRFARLTNAFSKKIESHEAAIALHYMHYNFARIHQTLRVTPAMGTGILDHVWTLEEIVSLLK